MRPIPITLHKNQPQVDLPEPQGETGNTKLLEKNIGSALHDAGMGEDFLDKTSFTQESKWTSDKWDLTKLQSFHPAKEITNPTKWIGSPQGGGEYSHLTPLIENFTSWLYVDFTQARVLLEGRTSIEKVLQPNWPVVQFHDWQLMWEGSVHWEHSHFWAGDPWCY